MNKKKGRKKKNHDPFFMLTFNYVSFMFHIFSFMYVLCIKKG